MPNQSRGWPQLIDDARGPAFVGVRDKLLADARKKADAAMLRRVYRFEEIGQHRTWLDGRALPLEPEIQQTFALAMSDHGSCGHLAVELPLIATAFRLTGDESLKNRVLAQLSECSSWTPLQRPGWTCYQKGSRLPADGKDGNWLATGTGIRGIATALDIMPKDALPADLRGKIHALLRTEIADIVDDWKQRRPWFVKAGNAFTNQWVLPTEGLVRACIVVGLEANREAYELGVANLLKAIDAHGQEGEFEEGLHYANFTVTSMFHAAHAMAVIGDRRAIDRPFLRRFSLWAVHHLMPARLGINAFDAFGAGVIKRDHQPMREILSAAAAFIGDPVAGWALVHQFDGPTCDPTGLAAAMLPTCDEFVPPPLYAAYERATRVNWRSSWRDDATGVWARGGHETDQHDHHDRGHVSFILRGTPVLIETGTPAYHHPDLSTLFGTGPGHNVLQIGLSKPVAADQALRQEPLPGWQKPRTVAPILKRQLNADGGDIQIDITRGYDGLKRWFRNLTWNIDALVICDEVAIVEAEVILFRWHLAATTPVEITGRADEFVVDMPGATIKLTASSPIEVAQEPRENHSLELRDWDSPLPYPNHMCLLVRSPSPVSTLVLTTSISHGH